MDTNTRQQNAPNTHTVVTNNPEETKAVAHRLIGEIKKSGIQGPVSLMLQGDLGSGKTVFVKGIGEYFDVETVISPSFVICYEYPLTDDHFSILYHFDLYNTDDESELDHVGLREALRNSSLLCVEWSDKLESMQNVIEYSSTVIPLTFSWVDEETRRVDMVLPFDADIHESTGN